MPRQEYLRNKSSGRNVASMNRSYSYNDDVTHGNFTSGKLPFEENDETRFRTEAWEKIDEETDPENFLKFGTPESTGYYSEEEEDEYERYPGRVQERQMRSGGHIGKGPRNYKRSDERIYEDVNEALMMSADVNASDIVVNVNDSVVTLTGFVNSRTEKREAEYCADDITGVVDVINNLEIRR